MTRLWSECEPPDNEQHGPLLDSIALAAAESGTVSIPKLPSNMQPTNLDLRNLCLQMPHGGAVLAPPAYAALTQLRIDRCDIVNAFAAGRHSIPLDA
jgi:hypothetical protein